MTGISGRKLPQAGESVTVIGAGRSGLAAARLARILGYRVRVMDEGAVPPETTALLRDEGIDLQENCLLEPDKILSFPFAIVSPGVSPRKWAGREAPLYIERIVGEMEWASSWSSVPLVAVGGTNGKSTTSALLAHLLEAAGEQVFLGGNFGTPLSEMVQSERMAGTSLHSVAVVELSSFQAETMGSFRPVVNLLLNITPDHLDRYPSLEILKERSLIEYRRKWTSGRHPPDFPMKTGGVRAQFEHVSENGQKLSRLTAAGQRLLFFPDIHAPLKPPTQGKGVRIIMIEQHKSSFRRSHFLHPPRKRLETVKSSRSLSERNPQGDSRSKRQESIHCQQGRRRRHFPGENLGSRRSG